MPPVVLMQKLLTSNGHSIDLPIRFNVNLIYYFDTNADMNIQQPKHNRYENDLAISPGVSNCLRVYNDTSAKPTADDRAGRPIVYASGNR